MSGPQLEIPRGITQRVLVCNEATGTEPMCFRRTVFALWRSSRISHLEMSLQRGFGSAGNVRRPESPLEGSKNPENYRRLPRYTL